MTTYYKKVGRRYIPVAESETWGTWTEGDYLVNIRPSCRSVVRCLEPEFANVEAALMVAQEGMARAIAQKAAGEPATQPIDPDEQAVWDELRRIRGERATLWLPSAHALAQAGIGAVREAIKARRGGRR